MFFILLCYCVSGTLTEWIFVAVTSSKEVFMSKLNPDNTPETTATEQWTTMPLSAIRPGKHNPRRHADRIEEIAVSIENDGLFHTCW